MPPPATPRMPASVSAKVQVSVAQVMVVEAVRPLKAVEEVARTRAPVSVWPAPPRERTPLLERVPPVVERPVPIAFKNVVPRWRFVTVKLVVVALVVVARSTKRPLMVDEAAWTLMPTVVVGAKVMRSVSSHDLPKSDEVTAQVGQETAPAEYESGPLNVVVATHVGIVTLPIT